MMLTQERLKEYFSYDSGTGLFTRIKSKGNRAKVGSIAGCDTNGYIQIRFEYKLYYGHQLAWLYTYGYIPEGVDHKNQNGLDNRIDNLREANQLVNNKNHPLRSTNTSGFVGVTWNKRVSKWMAQIQVNGKCKGLGYYYNKEDAIEARKKANVEYGFHENHGKREVA